MKELPRPLATVVGAVLGSYYFHHNTINTLFYECGATGDPPEGNCEVKITQWLLREAKSDNTKAFSILGKVLEEFMDGDASRNLRDKDADKKRIEDMLEKYGLKYQLGGRIYGISVNHPSRSLDSILRNRDMPQVSVEFDRAIQLVDTDPPAAVTAACSILESLFKIYIEDEGLSMPSKQTISPLWATVSKHIGLAPTSVQEDDLRKILSGLTSIVTGIGSFRTHASSAHGMGRKTYRILPRHARFVVNSAHTLVMFVMETWDSKIE